ncbi:hypothetical protein [Halopseudomonas sabulinigri]|uniref:Uncharacterized protein n=1 Tax=Halopseudomonas sabulinigri TaxID=472181 RepID=A0ABP9ZL28_9GAMM
MTILTKFDAAERQLLQAIRLFFREEDAISIHTLSEAASQILYDIGKETGIKSMFRDSDRIREDKKKEFFSYLFKSRNFFKHADKDKDETHEFKDEFNEFSLIDSVNLHSALKKKWTPETLVFDVWFCLHRPNLLIPNTEYSNLISKIKSDRIFPSTNEKSQFYEVIEQLRSGKSTAQNLTLAFGL